MMDLKKNSWDGMQNEKNDVFILIDGTECNVLHSVLKKKIT
jgi:hypothetical protein